MPIKLVDKEPVRQETSAYPVVERRNDGERRKALSDRRKTGRGWGFSTVPVESRSNAASFVIDDRRKLVFIEGKRLQLSPKEFALLSLLALDPGRVVSNEEIVAFLWADRSDATVSDVRQSIYLLRKRIEKDPKNPRWIRTVSGFGYQLIVTVQL